MAYLAGNARLAAQLIAHAGESIEAVTNKAGRLPEDLTPSKEFPKLVHAMVSARANVRAVLKRKKNQVIKLRQQVLGAPDSAGAQTDSQTDAAAAAMLLALAPKDKTPDQSLNYLTYMAIMEEAFHEELLSGALEQLESEPSSAQRRIGLDTIAKMFWQLRRGHRPQEKAQRQLQILDRYQKASQHHVGKTRMKIACQHGDAEAVKFFIQQGDDPDEMDKNYSTPIMHASWSGHSEVARVLLGAGVDLNTQNLLKNTALHFAFEKNHVALASLFLACGAPITIKNVANKTAKQLNRKAHKTILLEFAGTVVERGFQSKFSDERKQIVRALQGNGSETELGQRIAGLVFDKLPLPMTEGISLQVADMFFQKLLARHDGILAAWKRVVQESELSVTKSVLGRLQLQELVQRCIHIKREDAVLHPVELP